VGKGKCGEIESRTPAFVASSEHKQTLDRGREKADILADRLNPIQGLEDSAEDKGAQSAPDWERKQPFEYGQQSGGPEVLGCAVISSLQGQLDALRSVAEATRIKERQALDQERDRADALARELTALWTEIDTARTRGSGALQAPEAEIRQKQELKQAGDRAEAGARELTALRAELDAARIGGSEAVQAATAAAEQKQALEHELKQARDRAEADARELTALRAEFDAARIGGSEAVQAATAAAEQKQAIEQELKQARDRAEASGRELTSLRTELDAARIGASEAARAAVAPAEQKQALERELKQVRDRAEAGARELTSLQAELAREHAAGLEVARTAEVAKIEQRLALGKEREKAEGLARELASARKETDERSALLAAAQAEVLQVTERNSATAAERELALVNERDRVDALTRELTSVRNKLEAGNGRIAALSAQPTQRSCDPAAEPPGDERPNPLRGRPNKRSGRRNRFLTRPSLRPRHGRSLRNCRARRRHRSPGKWLWIRKRKSPW
jgi:chromosome segregation ATPase